MKDYYNKVVSLFEATADMPVTDATEAVQNPAEMQMIQNQQQAISGEVMPPNQFAQQEEVPEEMGMDDANYLLNQENNPAPTVATDAQKLAKLFDLFTNLRDYCNAFLDCIGTLDFDILDFDSYSHLSELQNKLEGMKEKIEDYLKDVFKNEKFEKALYVYVLFRTEMLTIIKATREVLELNKVDEEETHKL